MYWLIIKGVKPFVVYTDIAFIEREYALSKAWVSNKEAKMCVLLESSQANIKRFLSFFN